MSKRYWTDEQLAEMGKRTIDKALEALEANDKEKATLLVKRVYEQSAFIHDCYMSWVGGLLSYIYEHGGMEEVEKAERYAHEKEAKIAFKPPERTDFKFTVERMADELDAHVYQDMTLIEDDEKLVMEVSPCGSGGRLIQKGAYGPEVGFAKVKEPSDLTFNTADYPIYCCHCALFNMNAIDETGSFIFINNPPAADGSKCQWIFYKDKADIPDEYYARIGREKPRN